MNNFETLATSYYTPTFHLFKTSAYNVTQNNYFQPNNKNADPDHRATDDISFKAVDTYSGNLNDDDEDYDEDRDDEPPNEDSEELTVLPLGALRKKPWKSCLKSASKICTKACKVSYKEACSYRGCQKKLKKSLKKECKRQCKSFFLDY